MIDNLIKIGLSEKEASVYLATLELGSDSVQNIAKLAKINRATAYVILEKLMNLGLVSTHIYGKKTAFVAENPKELNNLIENQKKDIELKKQKLEDVMNSLVAIYNLKEDKPIVRYFEGADGLEALDRFGHEDLKKTTGQLYAITPADILEEQFPMRRKKSVKERVKQNIKSKVIYTHKNGPFSSDDDKASLREGIFLPRDILPLDGTISIYENWGVKLYTFDKKYPYGVLIQSPIIAKNLKYMFDLAWLGARQKQNDLKMKRAAR